MEKIKEHHLSKIAYVYIRQSTTYQAEHNLESQKRQYQLVDKAKELGFLDVRVIDEDIGLSAGESSKREGFKKLVADVSLGKVGIIFGLEVSRFARNNRDWYYLLDLCAIFDTLIADQDGIYHPAYPNDRMLLGLKGTMSEVEINLMKNRMLEGARNKAKRGGLISQLPIGYIKTDKNKIEKDPDERIQKIILQIFEKFRESQSARQSFLWFIQENIPFPLIRYGHFGKEMVWDKPVYQTIYRILRNPIYAGAYVYGRRETRQKFSENEIKKTKGHYLEMKDWKVLIKDNHTGYISWEEYEKNQRIISENNKSLFGVTKGPILKGKGLLSGLLRCGRCGQKLVISYGGKEGRVPHYRCLDDYRQKGTAPCLGFGGLGIEKKIKQEVLRIVEPCAIEASIKAVEEYNMQVEEQKQLHQLECTNAEYETERAYRQYNKVEPENRLVVAQLEKKWNQCLVKQKEIEEKIEKLDAKLEPLNEQEKTEILELVSDFPVFWNSETVTDEMRKKVIRTVIEEIIANVDEEKSIIQLNVHWVGGIHTGLELKRKKVGEHNRTTDKLIVELIKQMAQQLPDDKIAAILNKNRLKTGEGNNWTRDRVRWLRNYNNISVFDRNVQSSIITLDQAAQKLEISTQSVRKLIKQKIISASQIILGAPWSIPKEDTEKEEVKRAVERIKKGTNRKKNCSRCDGQIEIF